MRPHNHINIYRGFRALAQNNSSSQMYDRAALDKAFVKNYGRFLARARTSSKSLQDAQDLLHDTYLICARFYDKGSQPFKPERFISLVMKQQIMLRARRGKLIHFSFHSFQDDVSQLLIAVNPTFNLSEDLFEEVLFLNQLKQRINAIN